MESKNFTVFLVVANIVLLILNLISGYFNGFDIGFFARTLALGFILLAAINSLKKKQKQNSDK